MSFDNKRVIQVMTMLWVTLGIVAELEPVMMETLLASEDQLFSLADAVCNDFFLFEETDQYEKITNCIDNFSNSTGDISALPHPSKLEITCQSEKQINFRIEPLRYWQLVVLVSTNANGFVNFNLINMTEEIGEISTQPSGNYTIWSTVLHADGTPSLWLRGADVATWVQDPKMQKIKIEKPHFQYTKGGKHVEAIIKWDFSETISSCSDIMVTNGCNKKDESVFVMQNIKPEIDHSVRLTGLPLDDFCTFGIHGKGENKLTYRTPSCDQLLECRPPLPEIPKDISIEANRASSGLGWDVRVGWSRPKHAPLEYNVTLRASGVSSVVVPGNATEVTIFNVKGEGLYNVSVGAIAEKGRAFSSSRAMFPVVVSDPPETNSVAVIVAGAWCGVLLLAATVSGSAVWWRRRRAHKLRHLYFQGLEDKFPKDCGSEIGQESGVEDSWELRTERLVLHEVIGEGAFGVVRRGTLAPGSREVAVKMLKDFPTLEEIRSFRAEMELMKSVGAHSHVVSLVGCCSGRRPLIVAEYCNRGDLLTYLRRSWDVMVSKRNAKYYNNNIETSDYRNDLFKNQPEKVHSNFVANKLYDLQGICDAALTSLDLLSFCRQIAKGMEFLSSNRVVHRDLAARNVLISGDKTLKIADFGLSRDVYQENQYKQKGNGKMPVKWMALESLTHRIYTTQSDVWSFGVVVWEVVTVGGAPYPEVPAARLPRLLRAGYRMPRPNNCSKQLYELMLSCWRARPRDRPTFSELHYKLDELLNSACANEYLSLELEGDDPPPTPKPYRYVRMLLRGNRVWARGECYERPLKAPHSNHYSSPPSQAV